MRAASPRLPQVAFVNADNALSLSWVHRSTIRGGHTKQMPN